MRFGPEPFLVTIRRRAVAAGAPAGVARGAFADSFQVFGSLRPMAGSEKIEAGFREDDVTLVTRVPDTAATRTITNSDRLAAKGFEFAIVSAGLPVRRGGFIELTCRRLIAG
jgi:head-tail adaptor